MIVEFTARDFANYFINRVMPLAKKHKKQHGRPLDDRANEIIQGVFIGEKAQLVSRKEGQQILEQHILGVS